MERRQSSMRNRLLKVGTTTVTSWSITTWAILVMSQTKKPISVDGAHWGWGRAGTVEGVIEDGSGNKASRRSVRRVENGQGPAEVFVGAACVVGEVRYRYRPPRRIQQ